MWCVKGGRAYINASSFLLRFFVAHRNIIRYLYGRFKTNNNEFRQDSRSTQYLNVIFKEWKDFKRFLGVYVRDIHKYTISGGRIIFTLWEALVYTMHLLYDIFPRICFILSRVSRVDFHVTIIRCTCKSLTSLLPARLAYLRMWRMRLTARVRVGTVNAPLLVVRLRVASLLVVHPRKAHHHLRRLNGRYLGFCERRT